MCRLVCCPSVCKYRGVAPATARRGTDVTSPPATHATPQPDGPRHPHPHPGSGSAGLGREPDSSLGDIAEAAGVARRTVYAHFAGRDALVGGLAAEAAGGDTRVHSPSPTPRPRTPRAPWPVSSSPSGRSATATARSSGSPARTCDPDRVQRSSWLPPATRSPGSSPAASGRASSTPAFRRGRSGRPWRRTCWHCWTARGRGPGRTTAPGRRWPHWWRWGWRAGPRGVANRTAPTRGGRAPPARPVTLDRRAGAGTAYLGAGEDPGGHGPWPARQRRTRPGAAGGLHAGDGLGRRGRWPTRRRRTRPAPAPGRPPRPPCVRGAGARPPL